VAKTEVNPYNTSMALKLKPEYISAEDFRTYTGINLDEELNGVSPDVFLRDCEDELISYVNMQSWRPISRWIAEGKYTPDELDAIREAIIIQARYVLLNGDVAENNGIDPETGVRMSLSDREEATIAPNAINKLKMAGILTLKMKSRF